MLGLLGDHRPCLLFKQFLLEQLPKDIYIQLVDFKFDDHCQLAKWANALWACWDMESDTNAIQHRPLAGLKIKPKTHASSPRKLRYSHRTSGEAAWQCT